MTSIVAEQCTSRTVCVRAHVCENEGGGSENLKSLYCINHQLCHLGLVVETFKIWNKYNYLQTEALIYISGNVPLMLYLSSVLKATQYLQALEVLTFTLPNWFFWINICAFYCIFFSRMLFVAEHEGPPACGGDITLLQYINVIWVHLLTLADATFSG